jgi:hypothetical protein
VSNVQHHIFQRKILGLAPFFFALQKNTKKKNAQHFALQNISTCF